jgi:NADH:ubiquinone oxidoreductase subunit 6 (subunit J)
MPIILSNITRLSDSTVQSFFNKFWATPIFMYVSSVYTFCLVIICVCLYFNRRNNLIYKVLNLAVLSVFVVALWSYLTDVTFIYVVYILTFVSAVVMLFLSVVLMLPSSAVAVPKKSVSYIIFILFTDGSTIFYGASFTAAALAIYTLLAFYTKSEQPFSGAVTFSVDMSGLNAEQLAKSKNLTENCVYTVANGQSSQSMFLAPVKFDYLNNRLSIRGYSGTYPVYLATNKIFLKHLFLQNRYARMLFQPMCEFLIRAIHLYRAKNSLLFRLPQLIHNYDVELFSVMAQNGVSIYLNGDRQKEIILVSNKP